MSDYREVLQNPKVAFKSSDLQDADVKQTPLGLPSLVSGGFALTACLTTKTNNKWAIRCFHKEVIDLQDRYKYISDFLQDKTDNFFVKFKYEIKGIQFRGTWYPIVRMAWVEGNSLSEYIEDNLSNPTRLISLTNQLKSISRRLHEFKMAHGDLQHGNILVSKDGNLVLIDYDGMYVPGMPYKHSNELGHVAFQHPSRNSSFFTEKVDFFSTIVLYVSLLSLASPSGKELWRKYHTGENLIFSRNDYQNPENSIIFSEIKKNYQLSSIVSRLQQICHCSLEDVPTLDDFLNPNITLSLTKVVTTLPVTSNSTNGIASFVATETLKLVEQEGEKITVNGQVIGTYLLETSNILFINFGRYNNIVSGYSSFTMVVFPKGLNNLLKIKQFTVDYLKELKGKYLQVTGILELYPNKKGYIVPQIILEDPYQLKILTQSEATDILKAPTKNTSRPVNPTPLNKKTLPTIQISPPAVNPIPQPVSTRPLPPKPVPPPPRQASQASISQTQNQKPPQVPNSYRKESVFQASISQTQNQKPPQVPNSYRKESVFQGQSTSSTASQANASQNKQSAPVKPLSTTNTSSSKQGYCFVATAAYESKDHPDLETFRAFRDQILLKHTTGKYLVNAYYWVGPCLAKPVSQYLPIKKLVRTHLERLAQWIRVKRL